MDLDLAVPGAAAARRDKLAAALGGRRALLFAGQAPPRNYPDAPYPFRASSHFLYFVGLGIERAVLDVQGDEHTLYVEPPAQGDALWHGPTPGLDDLARAAGCPVRPLGELRAEGAATIPAVDLATRSQQQAALGRSPSTPTDADLALADAIIACRLIHDEAAIAGLREAAEGTTAAHLAGMRATRPGRRAFHVRAAMEATMTERGMTPAYGSIVTVHGEVLHDHAHHHLLSDGDLLLADVGAESRGGWAGDVTRTWPTSGSFSATQRAMYEVVLGAQRAALAAVRPGARYRDVHLAAARALTRGLVDLGVFRGDVDELVADGAHALFFPHGVGHLLGLDVHDMEDLGDRAGYAPGRERSPQFGLCYLRMDRDLAPGMAVTIEPGFYQVPAILGDAELTAVAGDRLDRAALGRFADVRGIRIEDDVLVTLDGHEVLTAAIPKTAGDVEACVSG
ncbi:MAG: aminopeptidase P family protein [Sandaracinaceae bacterium]|nr:aminopeptidase P family protein [Sandaracinaceae bacterium]